MGGASAIVMLAWLAGMVLTSSRVAAREVGPEANLCAEINALSPGEEIVLRPGQYQGPCAIRRGGRAGAPLVIRGADPVHRPRIVYGGRDTNVLEVRASHVIIRGLEFGPTQTDVDAVRIFAANDVTIEDCHFAQLGGIAVVANHSSVRGLVVRRNVIRDTLATPMYFGCHDGAKCSVTALVVERNVIQGVTAPDPAIGYGIEVKLNSTGVVRDNVVLNTKGPGIMVFGSRNLEDVNLVERNVTIGSRTSSGIVVGGGPAIVRNNVAASNEQAGIGLEDYQKRGLLRKVFVANNTVYKNRAGGITMPDTGISGVVIVNNAAEAGGGAGAYPAAHTGVWMAGNVDCTTRQCFANPQQDNFSPHAASVLRGAGVFRSDPWMPLEDFFGARRSIPPTAGAIERPSGPLSLTPQP
jgi:Right handed beta helix region